MKRSILTSFFLASVCVGAGSVTVTDFIGLEDLQPDLERLVLGIEGQELALELVLNADSLGVEQGNAPGSDRASALAFDSEQDEIRAHRVAKLVGELFDVTNIVSIPAEAGCVGASSSAKQEMIAGQVMVKTEHALNCLKPELIDVVEVNVFDLAPKLRTLEVELVNQTRMTSSTVTPSRTIVSLFN